jgi:hypothetical protein
MSKWLDAAWLKEQLEQAERAYKAGNKSRILHGVVLCTAFGLDRRKWPQWLDRAFNDAYAAGISGAIASWDEVFGRPIPKGKRRKAYQLQRQSTLAIVHRVEQLHATRGKGGKKTPIDKGLFETVGEEFGIGATTASKIYYSSGGRWLRDILRSKNSAKS